MRNNIIHVWAILHKGQRREVTFSDQSSLDAISRQLPDGFYSTFRTYGGGTRVIGLKAHLRRLYEPVPAPDVEENDLRKQLSFLLNDYVHEARVRVVMTKQGQVYIMLEPLKLLSRDIYKKGVRVETTDMARNAPRLKSTAFIATSNEERIHIAQKGIFEALLVKNGKILEGMTSNFFCVRDKMVYTAQRDILLGVTRQTVIRVARGLGLEVKYWPLNLDQLKIQREAFITSSSRGVVPVVQIDDVIVGQGRPGQITKKLAAAYDAYVLAKAEKICKSD
jgi:branched-chain amino acid aminotransferase